MKHLLALTVLLLTSCATVLGQGTTKVRWYGKEYDGRKTASGEIFYHYGLTCASNSLPFGTKVEVTYNGKTAVVTVNDRGPNLIEITHKAFAFLADPSVGVIEAQYKIVK